MKKHYDNCHNRQASNLPVPTNSGSATIANRRSEEDLESTTELSCLTTGIGSEFAAERILCQGWAMLSNGAQEANGETAWAAVDLLRELRTGNATEGMLSVQMLGTHEAAVKFLRNATLDGQTPEGADVNVLRATRLMRLFLEQSAAMAKLKGKTGQQKVTVEHVHVNAGGQAIVGQISGNTAGGSK